MNGVIMMVIAIVVLGGGYLFYGRYLEKKWGIDPNAKTPAYELEDGVDYVPADTNIVFGHQFASIAGAGPINGPIQAAIFASFPRSTQDRPSTFYTPPCQPREEGMRHPCERDYICQNINEEDERGGSCHVSPDHSRFGTGCRFPSVYLSDRQ